MKKLMFLGIIFSLLSLIISCGSDDNEVKPIDPNILPNKSIDFIKTHFQGFGIVNVNFDDGITYKTTLTKGVELEFDSNGTWKYVKVVSNIINPNESVPPSIIDLLPDPIANVPEIYGQNIMKIRITDEGYEVILKNGRKLNFNKYGNPAGGQKMLPLKITITTKKGSENEVIGTYEYMYDSNNRLTQTKYKGITETITYNGNVITKIAGSGSESYSYDFTVNNNILTVTEKLSNGSTDTYEFGLDNKERIIKGIYEEPFNYDDSGNLTSSDQWDYNHSASYDKSYGIFSAINAPNWFLTFFIKGMYNDKNKIMDFNINVINNCKSYDKIKMAGQYYHNLKCIVILNENSYPISTKNEWRNKLPADEQYEELMEIEYIEAK